MPFPTPLELANKKLWIVGLGALSLIGVGIGLGLFPSNKESTSNTNENSIGAWPSEAPEATAPMERSMAVGSATDRLYGAEDQLSFDNLMDVLAKEQAKPPAREFAREFMRQPVLRKTYEEFKRAPKRDARDFLFTVRGTSEFRRLMARFASDPGFRSFLSAVSQQPEIGRLIRDQGRMDASRDGNAKGRSVLASSLKRAAPGGFGGGRGFQGVSAPGGQSSQGNFSGDGKGNSTGFSGAPLAQAIDAPGGMGSIGGGGAGTALDKTASPSNGSASQSSWGSGRGGASLGGEKEYSGDFSSVWGKFCPEIQASIINCAPMGISKNECCDLATPCKDGKTCKDICMGDPMCAKMYDDAKKAAEAAKEAEVARGSSGGTGGGGAGNDSCTAATPLEKDVVCYCRYHSNEGICSKCSVCQGDPSRLPNDVFNDCDFNCPGWRKIPDAVTSSDPCAVRCKDDPRDEGCRDCKLSSISQSAPSPCVAIESSWKNHDPKCANFFGIELDFGTGCGTLLSECKKYGCVCN